MSDDLLSGKRRLTVEEALGLMRTRMSGIYGLVDPAAPSVVRYVGSSTHLAKRLVDHARGYMPRTADGPKRAWLAGLKKTGRRPGMVVLELLDAGKASAAMHSAERAWIEQFRARGQADLNATLTAGERKFLRTQIEELRIENAKLRELLMQRATEAQRCICVARCAATKAATQHTAPLEGAVLRCT